MAVARAHKLNAREWLALRTHESEYIPPNMRDRRGALAQCVAAAVGSADRRRHGRSVRQERSRLADRAGARAAGRGARRARAQLECARAHAAAGGPGVANGQILLPRVGRRRHHHHAQDARRVHHPGLLPVPAGRSVRDPRRPSDSLEGTLAFRLPSLTSFSFHSVPSFSFHSVPFDATKFLSFVMSYHVMSCHMYSTSVRSPRFPLGNGLPSMSSKSMFFARLWISTFKSISLEFEKENRRI